MVFSTDKKNFAVGISAGVLGAFALGTAARADLTYVTKVTVLAKSVAVTTYVKGERIRTDTEQSIRMTDGTRTWLIDTKKKTYSVIANEKLEQGGDSALAQFREMIDLKMDATVKPGGKTKTILGKPAHNYVFNMTMRMNYKQGSGPKAPSGDRAMRLPVVTMKGESWTTDAISIPASLQTFGPNSSFRQLGVLGPSGKKAAATFATIKGFPMESTLTQATMGLPAGMKGGGNTKITYTVTSLKSDPIPDSLFDPPKGFKQVPYEAPTRGMGGMGGGGM